MLAATAAVLAMAGEGWHRPFAVLGPDQGMPSGSVTSLTQDADGFVWVGTETGLLRYEGRACSRWTREQGLPSDFIQRVLPDPRGGVWVATSRGLARVCNGQVESVRLGPLPLGAAPSLLALDRSGRLWMTCSQGLLVQQAGSEFSLLPVVPRGRVAVLAPGAQGVMHLGTDQGLQTFLPGGAIQTWGPADGLPRGGVTFLVEDGAGRIWAGSGRRLTMKARGATRFTDESRRLKGSLSPNSLPFTEADGSFWIPTQTGAQHLGGPEEESLDASQGLPFRWVRTVFRDREGTLWVLSTTLARLQGGGRVWNHSLAVSASGEVVWSITRDPLGRLLVATDDGAIVMQPGGPRRIPGTEGHRIKGLAVDRDGVLWMVSSTGPTLWLPPGGQRAQIAPLGDLGHALNTVVEDSRGTLWLGHARRGLLRWDRTARRLVQEVAPHAAGSLNVFRVREDSRGRLWAATLSGLFVRDEAGAWRKFNETHGLQPFGLTGMAFLPDGTAWVHYIEPVGMTRVRVEGDHLTVLEQRDKAKGLRSRMIYAVEVDRQGRTWLTTDEGLDRLDPPLHVGRREGAVSEDCAILALLVEPSRVWVGTAGGLVRYEAGPDEAQAVLPRPHILHVQQGERRVEAPSGSLPPVPARESSMAFRVAVPTYRNEGQLRIQVRMLGLEDAWRDMEDATLARYPVLPGGTYRFEARTVGEGGQPGPVAGLDFKVRPPWWRSWWALSLEGLGLLGLVALVVRARVTVLARSKADLEALVARRTEQLQVKNEELSAALGSVKQLSGLLPICASCKKIRDDKGYWNQLEQYFSDHTYVGFSHGICPECVETLYPGIGTRRATGGAESN